MSKRYIKNHLISLLLILSIFSISTAIFATTTSSIDSDFRNFYTTIKGIQKQLDYISRSIYTNKREDKSLDEVSNSLKAFKYQVEKLNSDVSAYSKDITLTSIYALRLETLSHASHLLADLIKSLEEQLVCTDTFVEYQLFRAYILADSFLNQTLSYFPENR